MSAPRVERDTNVSMMLGGQSFRVSSALRSKILERMEEMALQNKRQKESLDRLLEERKNDKETIARHERQIASLKAHLETLDNQEKNA